MQGIYQISIGSNFYFGQAQDLRAREAEHRRHLAQGRHGNPYMQHAYYVHGDLDFQVVLECSADEVDRYEQELIDAFHGTEGCMNIAPVVATRAGAVLDNSTKAKISASLKSHFSTEEGQSQRRSLSERAKVDGRASKMHAATRKAARVTLTDGTELTFPSHAAGAEHFGVTRGAFSHWISGYNRPAARHRIALIGY